MDGPGEHKSQFNNFSCASVAVAASFSINTGGGGFRLCVIPFMGKDSVQQRRGVHFTGHAGEHGVTPRAIEREFIVIILLKVSFVGDFVFDSVLFHLERGNNNN